VSGIITLNHGSGGKKAHDLIDDVFVKKFGMQLPLTDSAVLRKKNFTLAFTTDSYVVDPLFFPGGDIGKLAVCGTINDLSVSGAVPEYISASFIIEEGFPVSDLRSIAGSMADEASLAGVKIVTGDTKVVGKGKCDKLFITTSGVGLIRPEMVHISSAQKVKPGDRLIINGPLGNHAIAVLGARNNLSFTSGVLSDCCSLNQTINKILYHPGDIHFMRDLTRGGLSAVLFELVQMTDLGLAIDEKSVPIDDPVKGLCEVMGFDPLHLANEGKILIVAENSECDNIIGLLHSDPNGQNASVIGEVTGSGTRSIILSTSGGGKRVLDIPSGIQLPRIC
jgi:hydrogenase expression/formation protein HypE